MATDAWPVKLAPVDAVSLGASLWRLGGQLMVTVVAKVGFSFEAPEVLELTAAGPVRRQDEHRGGHPMRSLVGPSEIAPQLQRAEVTLVGTAHPTQPTARHHVRLAVAQGATAVIDKTLLVLGKRSPSGEPEPFTSMPLDWEHTFGGLGHAENPIGTGYGESTRELPNVVGLDETTSRPVGFGPIPSSFPRRRGLLDRDARKQVVKPLIEIPPALDWSYFQAAPADQQVAALHGNEWVALDGFSAERPQVRFRLPGGGVVTRVFGFEAAGAPNQVPLALDMLHIDTDRSHVALVWRGSFPIPSEASLEHLVVAARYHDGPTPVALPDVRQLELLPFLPPAGSGGAPRPRPDLAGTAVVGPNDLAKAASTLPFAGSKAAPPPSEPPRSATPHSLSGTVALDSEPGAPPLGSAPADMPLDGTMAITSPSPLGDALPFEGVPSSRHGGAPRAPLPGAPWAALRSPRPIPSPTGAAGTLPIAHAPLPVDPRAELVAKADAMARRAAEVEARRAAHDAREAPERAAAERVEQEAARKAELEARAAEEAARRAEEAAKAKELEELERAKAEAEARRVREAEKFRREQELAQAEEERRAREDAQRKAEAAKQLRNNMYGGFKRKR